MSKKGRHPIPFNANGDGRMTKSYYSGKIKVVCCDMMCFPARVGALEPLSTGHYDPYAWTLPETDAVETISHAEWSLRRNKMFRSMYGLA